jgi:type IV pilus assembly protein PilA
MKKNQQGFSLIELLIVVVIIGIIAAIAIPNLLAARRSANEAATLSMVRILTGAQATYLASVGQGRNFGDIIQLSNAILVDEVLRCPATPCAKSGYNFTITAFPQTSTSAAAYDIIASPVQFGAGLSGTGSKYLGATEIGVIWEDKTAPVTFDETTRLPTATSAPIS